MFESNITFIQWMFFIHPIHKKEITWNQFVKRFLYSRFLVKNMATSPNRNQFNHNHPQNSTIKHTPNQPNNSHFNSFNDNKYHQNQRRHNNRYHKRHHRQNRRKPKEPPKCGVCNTNESKYKFVFIHSLTSFNDYQAFKRYSDVQIVE